MAFFGGLWWTVRRGTRSASPFLWFVGSSLIRTVAALVGFQLLSHGDWQRMVSCLLGFFVARLGVLRLSGKAAVIT